MSLILEALKKLDREKEAPEHGFVVVASQAWPEPRRNRALVLSLVVLAVAVVVGLVLLVRPRPTPPVAVTPPKAVVVPPAASPAPSVPPPTHAARFELPTPRPAIPRTAPSTPAAATLRVVPVPATPPSLVLQAISERDGRPIALVSDRLVREGDEFDGIRIVRIGDAEVEIEWRGQRSILHF